MLRVTAMTVVCTLLAAAGCKGEYSSTVASEKEQQVCAETIRQYMADVKADPKGSARAPEFVKAAESFRIVKVEKAGAVLKALVEFTSGGQARTCYVLVSKKGDTYVVSGIL